MVEGTVLIQNLSGLFHGADIAGGKILCNALHVVEAGVSFCHAVFNEKFNELCGKMQFIIPEEDHVQIVLVQGASQIFLRDKDQFPDSGIFTERAHIVHGVGRAFLCGCLDKLIRDISGGTGLLRGCVF